MDKTAIKNFAIESRKILRESAIKKAGMYGITIDECSKPIQKGADFEVYKTIAGDEIRLYSKELKMRSNLVNVIKEKGFEQVIEETAYTWFNRLIAIRFMEVNDYLPTRVRVLSSETGSSTPDIVTHALDVDLNLSADEIDKIQAAKDDNRFDDAFQLLFVKQCNELNKILPGLFESTNDYMELLLDISYTSDGVVRMLVDEVPEDDFNVEKEGQVEIIGWLYQYYNTELKDDTFAKLKKNIKITKERIPAATQLFTPDWIVRYMVENSLGRVWIDHLRAVDESTDEKKIAEEFGWKYYLPEAEQEADVAAELVKIRADRKDLKPQDITCIDPCCGSGHILVYMFDVLLQIYESEGISVRDAVFDILEKNIHGLDIDVRAYQLSYFALMMKGRGAAGRRFFRGVETEDGSNRPVALNVYAIDESNDIDRSALSFLGKGMLEIEKNTAEAQVNRLLDEMTDAKEYGSIINVTECDWELVDRYLNSISADGQLTLGYVEAEKNIDNIRNIIKIIKILAFKYNVVSTNPPYMGLSGTEEKLSKYVKRNYSDSKQDLFAVFIEKGMDLLTDNGYQAMITQHAWMFLSSFESIRLKIESKDIVNMVHLGPHAFEEISGEIVQTTAFVINYHNGFSRNSTYIRLVDIDDANIKEKEFFNQLNTYNCKSNNYSLIPTSPMAYWISQTYYDVFKTSKSFSYYGDTKKGVLTGNDKRFVRIWYEVSCKKIGQNIRDYEDMVNKNYKWILATGGGPYRKWYGNFANVINMENDSYEIRYDNANNYRLRESAYYFRECITWSEVCKGLAVRYVPQGILFGNSGPVCFIDDEVYYWIALLNSKVAMQFMRFLSPTLTFGPEQLKRIPCRIDNKNLVELLSKECIELSKNDWDSYETSLEFSRHPFIKEDYIVNNNENGTLLKDVYRNWKTHCEDVFLKVKHNEEEINKIFIRNYGLESELSYEVDDKDITIRKADIKRDVKSLISYAVGCMFGRYSIDKDGLIYAGGDFDSSQYASFKVDEDAIIPITDEEFFDDDIVKRFESFIKKIYGEKSLEENLDFIAEVLGNKGKNSRDIIRNYFLNDFYKDHTSTYAVLNSGKRPIYWLFDSGKQNGFKCLIYMHRYTPDTVGLIRSVYLKKAQDAIESSLKNAEYAIANTESAVDRAANTRKRDKYIKQLAEIKPYYQALSHVAMQRIDIDLDDGVKVNYAKFQGVEVGGEGEKKQTIDLLAKI